MAFLDSPLELSSLEELGEFTDRFLKAHPRGLTLGLVGDLGAGKTAFARLCIQSICRRQSLTPPRVISPTYVIHQSYAQLKPPVEHFDLYRLEKGGADSLVELGYYDAWENCRKSSGFVLVEWPQRVSAKDLRLEATLSVELAGEKRRLSWQEIR